MPAKPIHLGQPSKIPESPAKAVLDRVTNPHPDTDYVARFTFPEFTTMCPVTGQPDFAIMVIDYVPNRYLIESKSLKLFLNSFRNHATFHEACTVGIGKRVFAHLSRAGCASAAISIPAAACRSTCSGRRAACRAMCGPPTRACDRTGGESRSRVSAQAATRA